MVDLVTYHVSCKCSLLIFSKPTRTSLRKVKQLLCIRIFNNYTFLACSNRNRKNIQKQIFVCCGLSQVSSVILLLCLLSRLLKKLKQNTPHLPPPPPQKKKKKKEEEENFRSDVCSRKTVPFLDKVRFDFSVDLMKLFCCRTSTCAFRERGIFFVFMFLCYNEERSAIVLQHDWYGIHQLEPVAGYVRRGIRLPKLWQTRFASIVCLFCFV